MSHLVEPPRTSRRPGTPGESRVAARVRARTAPLALAAGLLASLLVAGVALGEGPAASPPPALDPSPAPSPAASPIPTPDPFATPTPEPAAGPTAEPAPTSAPGEPPAPTAAPTPTPTPGVPPPPSSTTASAAVVITRSLYQSGAVVTQYTGYWCVPASVQTMANLILGTKDRSYATQKLLASVAYRFNRYRYRGPGNDIRGWSGALNWRLPDSLPVAYRDRSYPSRQAALDAIVDAIDETGYPVGITVWHGGHAWSVVGYRIRQVPDDRSTREILGFYVVGPLGSPRDPWPVRLMSVDHFLGNYTRYYEDRRREPWHNDYVLVRPERTTASARDWQRP